MSYSDEPAHRSTYTVEEVARILGISRTTAYECVRRGEIRARRFGRRVVIPTIVVDQLLNATDDLRPDDFGQLSSAAAASAASLCWPGMT